MSEPNPTPPELTAEEERFVEEYLIDHNGTEAYLRLYPHEMRSKAGAAAAELMTRPAVRDAIRERQQAGQSALAAKVIATAVQTATGSKPAKKPRRRATRALAPRTAAKSPPVTTKPETKRQGP